MFALGILQGSPDASLTWLLDVLLAFMVVVIVIGLLVESGLREQNQKPAHEENKLVINAGPSPKPKLAQGAKKPRSKRKSK